MGLSLRGEKRNDKIKGQTGKNCRAENAGDSEDSLSGWINSDYIIINPTWYVTEKRTSVYAWNDTAAPKVALLEKGNRLPILKEAGNWYLVSLRGAVGWIHK